MRAFAKTLFGDGWNIAGVGLIVAVGAGLVGLGDAVWAVFAMPAAALAMVGWLARR